MSAEEHGMRWMHGEVASSTVHGVGEFCDECYLVATDGWDLEQ